MMQLHIKIGHSHFHSLCTKRIFIIMLGRETHTWDDNTKIGFLSVNLTELKHLWHSQSISQISQSVTYLVCQSVCFDLDPE
jgi:hypothetical protein